MELKTVNHRFFDAIMRLPEALRSLEPDLRSLLNAHIRRGRVELVMHYRVPAANEWILDTESVRNMMTNLEHLGRLLDSVGQVNPVEILRLPGILRQREPDLDPLRGVARELLEALSIELKQVRLREGTRIAAELDRRLGLIDQEIETIQAHLPELKGSIEMRLRKRLEIHEVAVDSGRLEQEIVYYLARQDVAEELDRIKMHIAELRAALDSDESVGRRMDFLVQEMGREANTLTTKLQDNQVKRHGLEIKVLVEQLREQVQNVE